MIKKCINILFIYFVFANIGYSQDNTIKGLITSDKGETLPAANIYTKEFDYNTISDSIGHYKILIGKNDINDSLYFSYIGYETKKIAVKDLIVKSDIVLESKSFNITEIEINSNYWYNVINKAIANYEKKSGNIPFEIVMDFNLDEFKDNKITGSAFFNAVAYINKLNLSLSFLTNSSKLNITDIGITKKKFISLFPSILFPYCILPKLKSNQEIILDSIIKIDTNLVYCLTFFKRDFEDSEATQESVPTEINNMISTMIYHINIDLKSNDIYYYSSNFYNKDKKIKYKKQQVGHLTKEVKVFMTKVDNIMVPSVVLQNIEYFRIKDDEFKILGIQKIVWKFENIKKANKKDAKKYKKDQLGVMMEFLHLYYKYRDDGTWGK